MKVKVCLLSDNAKKDTIIRPGYEAYVDTQHVSLMFYNRFTENFHLVLVCGREIVIAKGSEYKFLKEERLV